MGNTKLLVFGLDGVPWNLLTRWIEQGQLPTLERLAKNGASGILRSAVPIGTPTSWSSIITGTNPGKHGIYEFMTREEGKYKFVPVDSTKRRTNEVWDVLSNEGFKVGVFNVPVTYPPSKVNGIMVSGLLSPEKKSDFAEPPELTKRIRQLAPDYRIHPRFKFQEGREHEYLQELFNLIEMRERILLDLLREDWDFFMTVFTESDAVQHAFWQYSDRNHPSWQSGFEEFENAILRVFKRLDESVGKAVAACGVPSVIVLSDHGNGPLYTYIHLNNFLVKKGFLKFRRRPSTFLKRLLYSMGLSPLSVYEFLSSHNLRRFSDEDISAVSANRGFAKLLLAYGDIDWSRSKAYAAMGFGQVFLNIAGREPRGSLNEADAGRIVEELSNTLRNLADPATGNMMVAEVLGKNELYSGPAQANAPDLVIIPKPGYAVFPQYSFAHHLVTSTARGISSTHTRNGIVVVKGPGAHTEMPLEADVVDVAPTVLAFFGLHADWMDGRPVAFDGKEELKSVVKTESATQGSAFSKVEEQELVKHLKDLGYA